MIARLANGTISAYSLGISDCPVCHTGVRCPWPELAGAFDGVAFPSCQRCSSRGRTKRTPVPGGFALRMPRPCGAHECCGQA